MTKVVISGTGLHCPAEVMSNHELVDVLNTYVYGYNKQHEKAIAAGEITPLKESSAEFIEKASGIVNRYVIDKSGILDTDKMYPNFKERSDDDLCIQAEMAVDAAKMAMERAGVTAADIDAVYMATSNFQRSFPGISIEIQQALGIEGYGLDLMMGCSSATFGIASAVDAIAQGRARRILLVNPEVLTGLMNFRDRDSHFIFGDVCTAQILEAEAGCQAPHAYDIVSTKLVTQFSNNIRSNFGYLNRSNPETCNTKDKYFYQQGRRVFKDIVPFVPKMIRAHLAEVDLTPDHLSRLWLHQANINMNHLIAEKLLGHKPTPEEAPTILQEFANTASAGAMIAFHQFHEDLNPGDLGVLCSFGAGYSIGNVILKKR